MTRRRPIPVVLAVALLGVGCANAEVEVEDEGSSAHAIVAKHGPKLGSIGALELTHYTLPSEEAFENEEEFLCSGRGVAMQGTGVRRDGTLVRYEGGGGGWKASYTSLEDCASAVFGTIDGVLGSSGRTLTVHYSIAVDERVIPMGAYVWLEATSRWYRADDTGGAIKGKHVDVFVGAERADLPGTSPAFVTMTPHAPTDPAPDLAGADSDAG